MSEIGKIIAAARVVAGMNQAQLGKAVGVSRAAVSQWEAGDTTPSRASLQRLARVLALPVDKLLPPEASPSEFHPVDTGLPIKGEVRAGAWLEIGDSHDDLGHLPITADPRYARVPQFALKVVGSSMNRVALPGTYVVVASWPEMGLELKDGDLIVVQRQRAMTYEVTLKRARSGQKGWELWPESTDPRYQEPILMEDGGRDVEVSIVGRVIGKYEPL